MWNYTIENYFRTYLVLKNVMRLENHLENEIRNCTLVIVVI